MSEKVRVFRFILVLCGFCGALLATLSLLLEAPQKRAQDLDQSRQLLIASKILSPNGYFLVASQGGVYTPAKWDPIEAKLVPSLEKIPAQDNELLTVYAEQIHPRLVNDAGDLLTFEEAKIDYRSYQIEHRKEGFAQLPLKLIFEIGKDGAPPEGYVIPINGYGLWDAIYGYLAISNDGNTVIGTTWYDHKETAGLGANITLPSWQAQFFGKTIFNETASEDPSPEILVVKGKVADTLGSSPKAKSAVDGISGASMTGKGVTEAYKESLRPYKPFLLKLRNNKGSR